MRKLLTLFAILLLPLGAGAMLNVLPSSSANHTVNRSYCNAELLSKIGDSYSVTVGISNVFNLPFFENARATFLSAIIYGRVPSFSPHVQSIVAFSSNEQMIGPHTWWIVTGMQDAKTPWNWPPAKFPSGSVRADLFTAVIANAPIAKATIGAAYPKPAFFCFVDVLPESFSQGNMSVFLGANTAAKLGVRVASPKLTTTVFTDQGVGDRMFVFVSKAASTATKYSTRVSRGQVHEFLAAL